MVTIRYVDGSVWTYAAGVWGAIQEAIDKRAEWVTINDMANGEKLTIRLASIVTVSAAPERP